MDSWSRDKSVLEFATRFQEESSLTFGRPSVNAHFCVGARSFLAFTQDSWDSGPALKAAFFRAQNTRTPLSQSWISGTVGIYFPRSHCRPQRILSFDGTARRFPGTAMTRRVLLRPTASESSRPIYRTRQASTWVPGEFTTAGPVSLSLVVASQRACDAIDSENRQRAAAPLNCHRRAPERVARLRSLNLRYRVAPSCILAYNVHCCTWETCRERVLQYQ